MRYPILGAAACATALLVNGPPPGPEAPDAGPSPIRVLASGCEPRAALHLDGLTAREVAGGLRIEAEIGAQLPARGVELTVRGPEGVALVGRGSVPLGDLDADRPRGASVAVDLGGRTDAALVVQVAGWLAVPERPSEPERVAATRWILVGDPEVVTDTTVVETVDDPLERLGRSLDSRASRLPSAPAAGPDRPVDPEERP